MREAQTEFVITEDEIRAIENFASEDFWKDIRSRPYTSASSADAVLDKVIEEIVTAAPEMEGNKLFIPTVNDGVSALLRR